MWFCPTNLALDMTPGRFRPADFHGRGPETGFQVNTKKNLKRRTGRTGSDGAPQEGQYPQILLTFMLVPLLIGFIVRSVAFICPLDPRLDRSRDRWHLFVPKTPS